MRHICPLVPPAKARHLLLFRQLRRNLPLPTHHLPHLRPVRHSSRALRRLNRPINQVTPAQKASPASPSHYPSDISPRPRLPVLHQPRLHWVVPNISHRPLRILHVPHESVPVISPPETALFAIQLLPKPGFTLRLNPPRFPEAFLTLAG